PLNLSYPQDNPKNYAPNSHLFQMKFDGNQTARQEFTLSIQKTAILRAFTTKLDKVDILKWQHFTLAKSHFYTKLIK
ncbi:hypothetical protein, partial [Haemophilus paraphrohaemolyticus]|uniref:hypothetical protein n=1 Tax=Haemophilus paraphrohaemolyticus TaxID=736 RepID=UPI000586EB65